MPRAAIVGNLVLDVVAGAPERPGGMVWYCARALSEIDPDADVVLVCRSATVDLGALTRDYFPLETLASRTAQGHGLVVDAQGLVRHGRVGPLVSDGGIDRAV